MLNEKLQVYFLQFQEALAKVTQNVKKMWFRQAQTLKLLGVKSKVCILYIVFLKNCKSKDEFQQDLHLLIS